MLVVESFKKNVICDAMRDLVLVLFAQFRKREKHPWRRVTFNKVAGFFHIQTEYGVS